MEESPRKGKTRGSKMKWKASREPEAAGGPGQILPRYSALFDEGRRRFPTPAHIFEGLLDLCDADPASLSSSGAPLLAVASSTSSLEMILSSDECPQIIEAVGLLFISGAEEASIYALNLLKLLSDGPNPPVFFGDDQDLAFQICLDICDVICGNRYQDQESFQEICLLGAQFLRNVCGQKSLKGALSTLPTLREVVYHLTVLLFGEQTLSIALPTLAALLKNTKLTTEGLAEALPLLVEAVMNFMVSENPVIHTTWYLSLLSHLARLSAEGILAQPASHQLFEYLVRASSVNPKMPKPSVLANLALYTVHKLTKAPAGMTQFMTLDPATTLGFVSSLILHFRLVEEQAKGPKALDKTTQSIVVEMLLRILVSDGDIFARASDLDVLLECIYNLLVAESASSMEQSIFGLEPEATEISEQLSTFLMRFVRNDRCRSAFLQHPKHPNMINALFFHFSGLSMSEADFFIRCQGLAAIASDSAARDRILKVMFENLSTRPSFAYTKSYYLDIAKVFYVPELRASWFLDSPIPTERIQKLITGFDKARVKSKLAGDDALLQRIYESLISSPDYNKLASEVRAHFMSQGMTVDNGKIGLFLERLLEDGLDAYKVGRVEDSLLDLAKAFFSLFKAIIGGNSPAGQEGGGSSQKKSPQKQKRPAAPGSDHVVFLKLFERLCVSILTNNREATPEEREEFSPRELRLLCFEKNCLLYLIIGLSFRQGFLSSHNLFSDCLQELLETIEKTKNRRALGNQLHLLCLMLQIGGAKLDRTKTGKGLVARCFATLSSLGSVEGIHGVTVVKINNLIQLRDDRWEVDVQEEDRTPAKIRIELSKNLYGESEEADSFLGAVSLLSCFTAFEDWNQKLASSKSDVHVFQKLVSLCEGPMFSSHEVQGIFFEGVSLLFRNIFENQPPFAATTLSLLQKEGDRLVQRAISNLQTLHARVRNGVSQLLHVLTMVLEEEKRSDIVLQLIDIMKERRLHGGAILTLFYISTNDRTRGLLFRVPAPVLIECLGQALEEVEVEEAVSPFFFSAEPNRLLPNLMHVLGEVIRELEQGPAGGEEEGGAARHPSWSRTEVFDDPSHVKTFMRLFFMQEKVQLTRESEEEEKDDEEEEDEEEKEERLDWTAVFRRTVGASAQEGLSFLSEMRSRKKQLRGGMSSMMYDGLDAVLSFFGEHILEIFFAHQALVLELFKTNVTKYEFLKKLSRIPGMTVMKEVMRHLEDLVSLCPAVYEDFCFCIFKSLHSRSNEPNFQKIFREFSKLWTFEERLEILKEKAEVFRTVDEDWGTKYQSIDLDHLVQSSQEVLKEGVSRSMQREPLRVRYFSQSIGTQPGQDDGGICRDWFHRLSLELLLPKYSFLTAVERGFAGRYQLSLSPAAPSSPSSSAPPPANAALSKDRLCRLLGRMLGVSLVLSVPLSVDFVPSFYKYFTLEELALEDLKFVDHALWRSISNLEALQGEPKAFEEAVGSLTFTSTDLNGNEVELRANGRNEHVTPETYASFKRLLLSQKLHGKEMTEKMRLVKEGVGEFLPLSSLRYFSWAELSSLVSPSASQGLNVGEWRASTSYEDISGDHSVVRWFWEMVEEAPRERQAKILQWVTGSSHYPVGGFANRPGPSIALSKTSPDHLPTVSTCLCRLFLPLYPTKKQLLEKLEQAMDETNFGLC